MIARIKHSFGSKLMLLFTLTTGVAVVVVTATMVAGDLLRMKPSALAAVSTFAEVTATHSTAALSFEDKAAGSETLAALRAVPEVDSAALYDVEGNLFASFNRSGSGVRLPDAPAAVGHRFVQRELMLTTLVQHGGQTLGKLLLQYDLDQYYEDVTGRVAMAATFGVVAIVLSLLLALQLRRHLERPIVELSSAARRVSRTKDYSTRATVFDDDELGSLTRTFNHMLEQIEHFQAQQEKAEKLRERHTAELERSNRELDEFAYVASHDLRSPLQGIKSLASWITEDNAQLLPAKSQRHLAQMTQRVERLERLLDDLLQYSRAGRVNGEIAAISTHQLCLDTVALLAPHNAFQVHIADDLPTMTTASAPLELVFRNLINNAVKHHDRDTGTIHIRWADADDFVAFSIQDDGPGIEPKYHEQIMKMFETLAPRDSVEGSGMGLAVIKKVVEGVGGSINVRSCGRGATFTFTWPKDFPSGAE